MSRWMMSSRYGLAELERLQLDNPAMLVRQYKSSRRDEGSVGAA